MLKMTHEEIVERQVENLRKPRLPFCVVLNNIRSLYNVGAIFRTADGCGVEKVWLCGITGYPPQAGISKTALGAEENVPWEYRKSVTALLEELKEKKYQIVILEQARESIPHDQFKPQKPLCLVIGNEVSGVDDDISRFCDNAIEIEMDGIKNSLNVAVAFGVVAYQIRTQLVNK